MAGLPAAWVLPQAGCPWLLNTAQISAAPIPAFMQTLLLPVVQGTSPVVTAISFVAILTPSFLQGEPLVTVGANNQRINYFLKNVIYFLFLAALGLCCYAQAFSSCGEPGLHSNCSALASHCGGFSHCKAWALGSQASVVGAHRLSCSAACGIFLDQGSNLCPLHQQVDSQATGPPGKS